MKKTTRSDKLRFAAAVALGARPGFDLTVSREESRFVVQVHSAAGISKADEDRFLADYPHGCVVACDPSEWQDAVHAALLDLAAAEDAALASAEPRAAWQDDAAEHLSPAIDPRDLDRIKGPRVLVEVDGYRVPVSVADARAMGAECAAEGSV